MSGPSDLARLTTTIDAANELLLSDEIKMMDVGDGVMRPTNAKVIADLSVQMNGAQIFTTIELGLASTIPNGYFSVLSATSVGYVDLYQNVAGGAVFRKSYPSSEKIAQIDASGQETSEFALAAYYLAQGQSFASELPWGILDKNKRTILGIKPSGAVHAVLDRMPGLDLLGEYSWAITDSQGVVLLGFKWSGETVVYGLSSSVASAQSVFANGPIGGQDIFVLVGGVPYQVTSSGDNFSPSSGGGKVSYLSRKGFVSSVIANLPAVGSVADFVTLILHIVSSGQSLSTGSTTTATTLQPSAANRLLTLQDGVRLTDQDGTLTAGMVVPFKPLVSKATEAPVVQLSAQLNRLRGLPSNAGILSSNHGRGGFTLAQLSKGTLPYTNSITAVTAAKAECVSKAYGYKVPFLDWIHGEADYADGPGVYLSKLLQLQSDYETDIKAISGQAGKIPFLLDQLSNWTAAGFQNTSNVAQDQLQAALDYPDRFVCAGPKYWLPTSDGTHMTTTSSMRLGCMHARAAQAIINGQSWLPTHCVSATRVGQKVTLKFHTPFGPLVVDKSNVSDPGNLGIRWIDSTSSATVTSVILRGLNTVEVTLSAVPTGASPQIGIGDYGTISAPGGPTTGARTCLRDSSPDLDAYGEPVYNWTCHQRINITTA